MKYKGIRLQLLGITFILIGLCLFTLNNTLYYAGMFLLCAVIGGILSVVGFFSDN